MRVQLWRQQDVPRVHPAQRRNIRYCLSDKIFKSMIHRCLFCAKGPKNKKVKRSCTYRVRAGFGSYSWRLLWRIGGKLCTNTNTSTTRTKTSIEMKSISMQNIPDGFVKSGYFLFIVCTGSCDCRRLSPSPLGNPGENITHHVSLVKSTFMHLIMYVFLKTTHQTHK